jgi:hypothetical protein
MAGDISGRGGTTQESYPGDFPGLLRLRHSPAHYECEGESKRRHPFWFAGPLLDCRFSIVGSKAKGCGARVFSHILSPNLKSRIENPKFFHLALPLTIHPLPYHSVRPDQHIRRDREADLLGGFEIEEQFKLHRLLDGQVGRFGAL